MPELDPDRILALSYVPARDRAGVAALWRLDAAMGAVLAGGREPLISQIKLAWWRDSLAKLDRERAPAEPVLEALATAVVPRGVAGAELAAMEEGWSLLLQPELGPGDFAAYAAARGGRLFGCSARLLGAESDPAVEAAGEAWALVDLARHSGNEGDRAAALAAARERAGPRRWPSRLRPLGMLAALARRDAARGGEALEPQGTPARMWAMLRHRLGGR